MTNIDAIAIEQEFIDELALFKHEIEFAIKYFYQNITFNNVLMIDHRASSVVNSTPMFWITAMGSLQDSMFMVLGRIFDESSKHNINVLVGMAQNNLIIFSEKSFRERKLRNGYIAPGLLDALVRDIYIPTPKDFRELRKKISSYRKIYEKVYRDIRSKVIAHRELCKVDDVSSLYSRTNITEIEKLLISLKQIYEVLHGALVMGKKPEFKAVECYFPNGKEPKSYALQRCSLQEDVIMETQKLVAILSSVASDQ